MVSLRGEDVPKIAELSPQRSVIIGILLSTPPQFDILTSLVLCLLIIRCQKGIIEMTSHALNVEALRAEFPALQNDQVYLDNAGGSQILGVVVDA